MRLEFLGSLIVSLSTLFIILSENLNGAQLGLTVTYAVQVSIILLLKWSQMTECRMRCLIRQIFMVLQPKSKPVTTKIIIGNLKRRCTRNDNGF